MKANINTNAAPLAPAKPAPQTRARFRQDKFSTTLHLPCFMPDDTKTPKA